MSLVIFLIEHYNYGLPVPDREHALMQHFDYSVQDTE